MDAESDVEYGHHERVIRWLLLWLQLGMLRVRGITVSESSCSRSVAEKDEIRILVAIAAAAAVADAVPAVDAEGEVDHHEPAIVLQKRSSVPQIGHQVPLSRDPVSHRLITQRRTAEAVQDCGYVLEFQEHAPGPSAGIEIRYSARQE